MKILNKQRKILLAENKLLSYFKYALGEIILVVLGILIAVSLNNWNETRKQNRELLNIHRVVKSNLQSDVESIDELLTHYTEIEDYYLKHIDSLIKADDYKDNLRLTFLILGFPELKLNQRGYNLLEKFSDGTQMQASTLSNEIVDFYINELHEVEADDKIRADFFDTNFQYWQSNSPWWMNYITRRDFSDFIEHAVNDADYKNRVATSYFINYKVFVPEIENYKKEALKLIESIK